MTLIRTDIGGGGNEEEIARGSIDISEFRSTRVLRKGFHCLLTGQGFSALLVMHVGHHTHRRPIDVQGIPLTKHTPGIYLPPKDYFGHDVLPSEWIDILPRRALSREQRSVRLLRNPALPISDHPIEVPVKSTLQVYKRSKKMQSD